MAEFVMTRSDLHVSVYVGKPMIEKTTFIPQNAIISGKLVGVQHVSCPTAMHLWAYEFVSITILFTNKVGKK